jgi:proteasome accessory factor C
VSDVHERLRRLLLVVPYVSRHQGISVDELARALDTTREQLLKELDLLTMVGRPPFQPDDCIDIYVDEGRVYVALDQKLAQPPRLTAAEAVALAASAAMLRPNPGDALHAALGKLEQALPEAARQSYRQMAQQIDADPRGPSELVPLSSAIGQRLEVEFDYVSLDRNSTERRVVRPLELVHHRGQWYLKGHDVGRADERLFRLDRVRGLTITSRAFAPIPTIERSIPSPVSDRGDVTVRFTAQVAPWVRERFGGQARPVGGGAVEVKVSGASRRWLVEWVMSFGGEATVVEPQWARQAVAGVASASIQSRR